MTTMMPVLDPSNGPESNARLESSGGRGRSTERRHARERFGAMVDDALVTLQREHEDRSVPRERPSDSLEPVDHAGDGERDEDRTADSDEHRAAAAAGASAVATDQPRVTATSGGAASVVDDTALHASAPAGTGATEAGANGGTGAATVVDAPAGTAPVSPRVAVSAGVGDGAKDAPATALAPQLDDTPGGSTPAPVAVAGPSSDTTGVAFPQLSLGGRTGTSTGAEASGELKVDVQGARPTDGAESSGAAPGADGGDDATFAAVGVAGTTDDSDSTMGQAGGRDADGAPEIPLSGRRPLAETHPASGAHATPGPSHTSAPSAGAEVPLRAPADLAAPEPGAAWEQVARTVHAVRRDSDGTHRMTMRLDPPELGSVEIEVQVRAGRLSVYALADSPATRDALSRALPELRASLEADGLSTGSLEVDARSAGGFGSDAAPDPRSGVTHRGARTDTGGTRGSRGSAAGIETPRTATDSPNRLDLRL